MSRVRSTAGRRGSGFDKFYGFIGGETNQWAPLIYDGTTKIEPPDDPDYHFTTDMTDQAITWAQYQQALTPDKPFFIYFATGATHAPHHVPAEWIAKYEGKFDGGWDEYREQTLARQIELGVVPPGTELAPKPEDIPDWETLSADEQRLYARQMEVFAAFAEHTDHEVGRLADAIEAMGEMDNTLFLYIFGDNGSSAEGGLAGTFNETIVLNGLPDPVEDQLEYLDEWGGPTSYPHFHAGWAVATNTPFQWTKQVASHYGGTRNPLVVHWPDGIEAQGEIRSQWHHVTDIAPTVMEAAGLAVPDVGQRRAAEAVRGGEPGLLLRRSRRRGSSHHAVLRDVRESRHLPRRLGGRHEAPDALGGGAGRTARRGHWELYHVAEDFSQTNDLAASDPAKLRELQDLFMEEAVKYNVLPLDDRVFERFNAAIAGRPDLMGDRTSLTLVRGHDRHDGERLHQREEPLAHDHRRGRDPRRWR